MANDSDNNAVGSHLQRRYEKKEESSRLGGIKKPAIINGKNKSPSDGSGRRE